MKMNKKTKGKCRCLNLPFVYLLIQCTRLLVNVAYLICQPLRFKHFDVCTDADELRDQMHQ